MLRTGIHPYTIMSMIRSRLGGLSTRDNSNRIADERAPETPEKADVLSDPQLELLRRFSTYTSAVLENKGSVTRDHVCIIMGLKKKMALNALNKTSTEYTQYKGQLGAGIKCPKYSSNRIYPFRKRP